MSTSEVHYPEFTDFQSRLDSFNNDHFENSLCPVPAFKLAKAGFFHYVNYYVKKHGFRHEEDFTPDLSTCFNCGVGLCLWEKDDDPFEVHLKHSPDCDFVVKQLSEHTRNPDAETNMKECIIRDWMSSLLVQEFMEQQKVSRNVLRNTLFRRLVKYDKPFADVDELAQSYNEMEKIVCRATDVRIHQPKKKSVADCNVCCCNVIDAALYPCGHVLCCLKCASMLKSCPYCRESVVFRKKVYLAFDVGQSV